MTDTKSAPRKQESMATGCVPVSFNSLTSCIPVGDATLAPFLSGARHQFGRSSEETILAFETPRGDRAAVSTDFALKLVLGADESAGHLVLTTPKEIPTVDQCMQTVLQAVVDTAARGEAAAVFLALSGAWERALREFEARSESDTADSGSPMSVSPCRTPPRRRSPSPRARSRGNLSAMGQFHGCLTRALEGELEGETCEGVADAMCRQVEQEDAWDCTRRVAMERSAVERFCTHGVECSQCHIREIRGTRYRCDSLNLCEKCRRELDDGECKKFTVYDHPWEATEDYEESSSDALQTPRPPLGVGDVGGRVMHLQYVLYKVGYLNVCGGGFRCGVYCRRTEEGIRRFQENHCVGDECGVYSAVTRAVLVRLVEEVERRCGGGRCYGAGEQETSARLRTAMAA